MSNLPQATPVGSLPASAVLDLDDDNQRIAYMKKLGATNTIPPMPRSSHLRNKHNNTILPWNELIAEQHDFWENCDATGNTDPAAWVPTVKNDPDFDVEKHRLEMRAQAHAALAARAAPIVKQHEQPNAVDLTPDPVGYPNGAVSYNDLAMTTKKLMDIVNS